VRGQLTMYSRSMKGLDVSTDLDGHNGRLTR
jgi:hypothetical protein